MKVKLFSQKSNLQLKAIFLWVFTFFLRFAAFGSGKEDVVENQIIDENVLRLDFDTIRLATDDFSPGNQLGEGGFGVVYKVIRLIVSYVIIFILHLFMICFRLNDH